MANKQALNTTIVGSYVAAVIGGGHVLGNVHEPAEITGAWTDGSSVKALITDHLGRTVEIYAGNVRIFKTADAARTYMTIRDERLTAYSAKQEEIYRHNAECSKRGIDDNSTRMILMAELQELDQAMRRI